MGQGSGSGLLPTWGMPQLVRGGSYSHGSALRSCSLPALSPQELRLGKQGWGRTSRCQPGLGQPPARAAASHGVVENDVLLGQFQQHGVVEELADAHVLTQALQGNTEPGLFPTQPLPTEPTEETLCPTHR